MASIGGPVVSGDSLDIYDDMIVAGSNRNRDVMQIFSLSYRRIVHTFDFSPMKNDQEAGFNFSTRFTKDGNFIISGGAGKNELKVFMNNADTTATFKQQMEITGLVSPVFTIDVSPTEKQFAFGLANG